MARIPTPGSASYTAIITMNLPKPKHSWVERTSRWTGTRYANISLNRQTDRSFLGKKKQEREETRFTAVPKGEYWGKPNKINMVNFQQMPAISVNINIK